MTVIIEIFHEANIHYSLICHLCLPHEAFHKLLITLEKPISMTTSLTLFGNKVLRSAIERNLVSFPAQVPVFAKHESGEVQARIAQLYFVAGWTIREIGTRYHMTGEAVRKSLTEWRVRAISSGYIQETGPDIFPALAGTTLDDSDDEGTESLRSLKVVPIPTVAQPEAIATGSMSALHMILEEIGQEGLCRWAPYRVRLLEILRRECIGFGLALSTVQVERIQAVVGSDPERANDLVRDLRHRIADEERSIAVVKYQGPGRSSLLHLLAGEIEATVEERSASTMGDGCAWPRHCARFLAAIEEGCVDLGMEFSLAQLKRIERALATSQERLRDLVRDLRNRLADEQERIALVCVARNAPRQLSAGGSR